MAMSSTSQATSFKLMTGAVFWFLSLVSVCDAGWLSFSREPPAPSCSWTEHPGKYLGGQDKAYPALFKLELAQKTCIEFVGVRCKGVTCTDPNGYSCAPRLGEPFLADSTDENKNEVSWVKHCEGLEKGMKVMSHFEAHGGKSFYAEAAEVVKAKEFQVTLKFLSDGATQVVPSDWVEFGVDPKESGGAFFFLEDFDGFFKAFSACLEDHPILSFITASALLTQIGVDLALRRKYGGKSIRLQVYTVPLLIVASYFLVVSGAGAQDLLLVYLISLALANAGEVLYGKVGRLQKIQIQSGIGAPIMKSEKGESI